MLELHVSGGWLGFLCLLFGAFAFGVVLLALNLRIALRHLRSHHAKLDAILNHHGLDWQATLDENVRKMIRDGKKHEAIRTYSNAAGVSFGEAMNHVERLDATEGM